MNKMATCSETPKLPDFFEIMARPFIDAVQAFTKDDEKSPAPTTKHSHQKKLERLENVKGPKSVPVADESTQVKPNCEEFTIGDWKAKGVNLVINVNYNCNQTHFIPAEPQSFGVPCDSIEPQPNWQVEWSNCNAPSESIYLFVPDFGAISVPSNVDLRDFRDFETSIFIMKTAKEIEAGGHNYQPGEVGHPETAFNSAKAEAIEFAKNCGDQEAVNNLEKMTFEGPWQSPDSEKKAS